MDVKHCFSLNQTFSGFKQIQNLTGLNVSKLKYYRYVIHFLIQLCICDSWQHPEHEDSLNKHDRSISPICNSKPKQYKKLKNTCQCPMPNWINSKHALMEKGGIPDGSPLGKSRWHLSRSSKALGKEEAHTSKSSKLKAAPSVIM